MTPQSPGRRSRQRKISFRRPERRESHPPIRSRWNRSAIFMPRDVPQPLHGRARCWSQLSRLSMGHQRLRAHRRRAQRPGRLVRYGARSSEPSRVEGKKTMYTRLLNNRLEMPDAILVPPAWLPEDGMWKAFNELEQLGWTRNAPQDESGAAADAIPSSVPSTGPLAILISGRRRSTFAVRTARPPHRSAMF